MVYFQRRCEQCERKLAKHYNHKLCIICRGLMPGIHKRMVKIREQKVRERTNDYLWLMPTLPNKEARAKAIRDTLIAHIFLCKEAGMTQNQIASETGTSRAYINYLITKTNKKT